VNLCEFLMKDFVTVPSLLCVFEENKLGNMNID
jgi:hypothetical protein